MAAYASTTSQAITPATCWPYDFACDFTTKPSAVLAATIREHNGTSNIDAHVVDWEWVFKSVAGRSVPHVRVRNIPGLPGGKTYDITLLVLRGED